MTKTPILDYLESYKRVACRLNMPGHKGKAFPEGSPLFGFPSWLDITEAEGADFLFAPDGIILESEKIASAFFGSGATLYSTEGSSLCIRTMLALVQSKGTRILAGRSCHVSFLNAAALLGLEVEFIAPEVEFDGCFSGRITPESVRAALSSKSSPTAVYITSPDYYGFISDISAIAEICHSFGVLLLVDNAHGAHLALETPSRHPIALGADMCCDSAHKTLPAFTGAAYLHLADPDLAVSARAAFRIFMTTSPSYLILASLDYCNKWLNSADTRDRFSSLSTAVSAFRSRLEFTCYSDDFMHLTLDCANCGVSGTELAHFLWENGVAVEHSDDACVIILFSAMTETSELMLLANLLDSYPKGGGTQHLSISLPLPKLIASPREALLSEKELLPIDEAIGRISAENLAPCPPGIPILLCGQVLDMESAKFLKRYGIFHILVVQ